MSERTLKWLVGALAIVVVAWAAVTFLGGRTGAPAGSAKMTAFFKGLTPKEVVAVHIQGPKDTVDLTQDKGVWKVDGAPTDSGAVARFWTDVKNATVQDLVATNPANHYRLGVAADSTWKVTFVVSSGSRTIYIGHTGPTYTTVYARLPKDNDVYTLAGGLRPAVVRTVDDWRNKKIVALDTSAVVHVMVKHGHNSFHLMHNDSIWELAKGGRASPSAVRNILSELSNFDALGFYHKSDSLPSEAGTLVALNGVGDTLTVLTVGSGEADRWVRVRGDTAVYKVAGYRVDRMMPELSTLREKKARKAGKSVAKKAGAKKK